MSVILFLLIIFILVISHEFGHFFIAKKSGIRVDEFAFGFPPKIYSFRKGETRYSINSLPFGGFVKIFGETENEKIEKESDKGRRFIDKPKHIQALVIVGGVLANIILAWILFSLSFKIGISPIYTQSLKPEKESILVVSVLKNSPAEKAGLKENDEILSFWSDKEKPQQITLENFLEFISKNEGKAIYLKIKNENVEKEIIVYPKISKEISEKPIIGAKMAIKEVGQIKKLNLLESFIIGAQETYLIAKGTILGIGNLIYQAIFGKADLSSVVGPVGIIELLSQFYKKGIALFLYFVGLISISLAVINLIPFPALDGGRLLLVLVEKIKGSPIKPQIVASLNFIGLTLLIILMAVVTYNDIMNLIR